MTNQAKITDANLKNSDLEIEMVASMSGGMKGALIPDRAMIRFQFMEFLLRCSIHKYFKSKVSESKLDSLKLFFNDIKPFLSKFDSNVFRTNFLWKPEANILL
jgi:NLR family CARD domain-containing protein 3